MKKVLCNVLYKSRLNTVHKVMGRYNVDVGLFDDISNAKICAKILGKILKLEKNFDIVLVDCYGVDEQYIPDERMDSVQIYYSVDDFIASNGFVKYYENSYGQSALMDIVDPIILEANKSWVLDTIK